jgi:2-oxoglutarate dehydrogenase E2 component (dihydrolipoamide succinyltransferase)
VKKEGDTVAIGETIARIDENGAAGATTSKPSTASGSPAAPPRDSSAKTQGKTESRPEDMRPSVRRLAEENKLTSADLKGSARGGQVTKEDVVAQLGKSNKGTESDQSQRSPAPAPSSAPTTAKAQATSAPPPMSAPTRALAEIGDFEPDGTKRVPMTKIRKKIAERLVQAQQTAAILTTFNEADMTAIMDLRAKHKERFEKLHGVGLGFMSFFARACVLALREFPRVNAEIDAAGGGDDVIYHNYVNLGIAVSTDRGLAVPVLRNVERMGFAQIEFEIKRLAAATREGKLSLQELSGGTFTITNGGVFGSLLSTPIINPPQSAILGMHAIQKRPIAVGDEVKIHPMMYLALSYDHRLIDGRESVSFLVRLKEYLEDPARLMLEI